MVVCVGGGGAHPFLNHFVGLSPVSKILTHRGTEVRCLYCKEFYLRFSGNVWATKWGPTQSGIQLGVRRRLLLYQNVFIYENNINCRSTVQQWRLLNVLKYLPLRWRDDLMAFQVTGSSPFAWPHHFPALLGCTYHAEFSPSHISFPLQ